jgi:hypothetical protein
MMKLDNVGDIAASRELMLDGEQMVQILIGKPERLPDHDDWYCSHQIVGIGSGEVKRIWGVDSVQALVLSLQMVGAQLYCSAEYAAGRLSWECGAVKGDLGLPVPENIRDVLPKATPRDGHDNG